MSATTGKNSRAKNTTLRLATHTSKRASSAQGSFWVRLVKNRYLYVMFLPVLLYYVIFKYLPMLGTVIAFKDYNLYVGIWESEWVGLKYFEQFIHSVYFWRLLRNTLAISGLELLLVFPAPIIFALMLNEVRSRHFKTTVQTISYLPHFISTVVIVGILVNFLSPSTGLINHFIKLMGGEPVHFLVEPRYFWGIFTLMNIWCTIGWNSIIYIAALSGIDPTYYEAATVDGAGRWRQLFSITLPALSPTIIILLIIRIGKILDVGYEAIILMYNSQIYETADVIATYVYRRGLIDADYSFAAAVGLFQSFFAMILVMGANWISKRYSETSLW